MTTHTYSVSMAWSGATTDYESYSRTHDVAIGAEKYTFSADPHYGGDASLTNPEELLLAAAASCQMLSFLAAAARGGVEVLSYEGDAEAFMPTDETPVRITEIVLRPVIRAKATTPERIERLLQKGHEICFIANSITSEIRIEPTIEIVEE